MSEIDASNFQHARMFWYPLAMIVQNLRAIPTVDTGYIYITPPGIRHNKESSTGPHVSHARNFQIHPKLKPMRYFGTTWKHNQSRSFWIHVLRGTFDNSHVIG